MNLYNLLIFALISITFIISPQLLAVDANPNIFVESSSMCGPNCLWQTARMFGIEEFSLGDISYIADLLPTRGVSLYNMEQSAKKMGLHAKIVKTRISEMEANINDSDVNILLLKSNGQKDNYHYVILDEVLEEAYVLLDGNRILKITKDQFRAAWTGYMVVVSNHPILYKNIRTNKHLMFIGEIFIVGILLFTFKGKACCFTLQNRLKDKAI